MKRVIYFATLGLLVLPLACTTPEDETFSFTSFSTTMTTTMTTTASTDPSESGEAEMGDGDGEPGDGDGMPGDGDGDGDGTPGDGDGDGDGDGTPGDGDGSPCPVGEFGCPCDNGTCAQGLTCDPNTMTCGLGGGDGDGDGDGDIGMCSPQDVYCLNNGCPATMGQGLVLDVDMDMINDWGWCLHECAVAADCPAHPAGGQVQCVDWSGMGDMACFLTCTLNNQASCAPGSMCSDLAGPPLCLYDASMF